MTNHTKIIRTKQPSTFNIMFNLNRRHTEALERLAKAKKRLAKAEESIASNLREALNEEDDEPAKPPPLPKKANDSAKRSPRQK